MSVTIDKLVKGNAVSHKHKATDITDLEVISISGGLVPKGAYNPSTHYTVGDSVDYLGSSYVMFNDADSGTLPTNTTYWQVIANKGETGEAGSKGDKGDKGDSGDIGATGSSATVNVGSTTTGLAGTSAIVVNSGTTSNAVLDFTIPRGGDGSNGSNGIDGKEVELQKSITHIQWKYDTDISWTDLIAISELRGDDGVDGINGTNGIDGTNGVNGTNGVDGKEVELQKTDTHIQWRLTGGSWVNLVALTDLKGDQGVAGTNGIDGADGIDGTDGADGQGVPTGGLAGQTLIKVDSTNFNTTWATPAGGGDMLKSVYDPTSVLGDVFDMDNMVEGSTTKILTDTERTKLSNTSGTNTGDQDLSGLVTKAGSLTQITTRSHTDLSDIGTNTHAQIDTALTRLASTSGSNTGDQTNITGNAGTATKLATARNINGVAFDGTANITITDATKANSAIEVTVATARTTATKIGTTVGGSYTPTYGDRLNVTFTLGTSVNSPTLNIDGSGAKSIYLGTTVVGTTLLNTTATSVKIPLWYDGTYYQMYGSQLNTDTNTTYIEPTSGVTVTTSTSATAVNTLYYANYAGTLAFTLPATATVNSVIEIVGQNTSNGWTVTAPSGDNIIINNTNTGSAGVLIGSALSTVKLRCVVANTTWSVTDYTGLITTNTGYTTSRTAGLVLDTTTVNGHALSSNVTVTASDIGLGNVDNTSDATKNSATATLTNKTLTNPIISSISNTGTLTLPTTTGTLALTSDIPTVPTKASGSEVDTGTDDAKFVTTKALKDSHNVPSVAPSTSGNVLTSNGTDWVSSTPSIYDSGWISLTLLAGASSYGSPWGTPAYRKVGTIVYLRGLVAGTAGGTVFATLPAGFRPDSQGLFMIEINPNTYGRLDIYTNGDLKPSVTSSSWMSLHGISFVADL